MKCNFNELFQALKSVSNYCHVRGGSDTRKGMDSVGMSLRSRFTLIIPCRGFLPELCIVRILLY